VCDDSYHAHGRLVPCTIEMGLLGLVLHLEITLGARVDLNDSVHGDSCGFLRCLKNDGIIVYSSDVSCEFEPVCLKDDGDFFVLEL
jgi:hypothetical protein